jgi:hypothetical protein
MMAMKTTGQIYRMLGARISISNPAQLTDMLALQVFTGF